MLPRRGKGCAQAPLAVPPEHHVPGALTHRSPGSRGTSVEQQHPRVPHDRPSTSQNTQSHRQPFPDKLCSARTGRLGGGRLAFHCVPPWYHVNVLPIQK